MKAVCVYLGAKPGNGKTLTNTATQLGQEIARRGLRLIYGGSSYGLMRVLAESVLTSGGHVTGIIPHCLIGQEKPLETIDELIVTETIQERKILMQQHADAFFVMPGGIGTLEEALETWNAIKIGSINKPIGFLNINNYFDHLFAFMADSNHHGFVSEEHIKIPMIESEPTKLLSALLPRTCKT